jgi:CspA family cold shock protein
MRSWGSDITDFDAEAFVAAVERLGLLLTAVRLADGNIRLNRWRTADAVINAHRIEALWAAQIGEDPDRVRKLAAYIMRRSPKRSPPTATPTSRRAWPYGRCDQFFYGFGDVSGLISQTENAGAAMTVGKVKFFDVQKGFGFISPDDGAPDVFVHVRALERAGMTTLNEGQRVSFDVVKDPRKGKTNAQNLKAV